MDHIAEKAIKALEQKIKELKAPTELALWQFRLIESQPQVAGLSSDDKIDVTIPFSWFPSGKESQFQKIINLPGSIDGISLEGSQVDFEFMLPLGAGIYINNQEVYREPSWTDSQAIFLQIINHFSPGIPINLEIRCDSYDSLAHFFVAKLHISQLTEIIFKLDLLKSQLSFCQFITERELDRNYQYQKNLRASIQALDLNALDTNQWSIFWKSADEVRDILSPFNDEAKTYTSHLIAHSHIDMNWLWSQSETIEICRRDFSTMLKLMAKYPEFHFSQSQSATYKFMELDYIDIFKQIKDRIKDGKWEVTASTWVESDLNMAAGEAIVRQLLLARRYAQVHLGATPLICWEPDTFGHPATLPQLLKKSGIKYYYFCRAGQKYPIFWWEGLDGSQILAVNDPNGYSGDVSPSNVVDSVIQFGTTSGANRGLYVYGVGDHGGGGTARDIEFARMINNSKLMPTTILDKSISFFQAIANESANLPTIKSELNTTHEGCYTSHADIKKLSRKGENLLLSTESAVALMSIAGGQPKNHLAEFWQTLCFYQFHDILCGCAVSITYREAHQQLEPMLNRVKEELDCAIAYLVQSIDTSCSAINFLHGPGKSIRLVVFNPLPWERDDVTHFSQVELHGNPPTALADETGNLFPLQVTAGELIFLAEKLPSLGLKVYRPVYNQGIDARKIIDSASQIFDNGILRFHVNSKNGEIDLLEDLETGRNLLLAPDTVTVTSANPYYLNRIEVAWEKPHTMSAWVIGEISHKEPLQANGQARVIENGPVRGIIEISRQFLSSRITQRFILYRKLRRIDIETEIDWHEHGSDMTDAPMLRVHFAPVLSSSRATFEIPFAGLEREANGNEVPALRWVDLSEENGQYGFSLLNNGKYGHQADGDQISLTLLRASYEPDLNPDEGHHKFTYSLYSHPGGWQQAQTIQHSAELNQPSIIVVSDSHKGESRLGSPWIQCDSTSVLVSAFKLGEDQPEIGRAYIVRLYESHAKPGSAVLSLGFSVDEVYETNMIEEPEKKLSLEGNNIILEFSPYEIKTIKLITS